MKITNHKKLTITKKEAVIRVIVITLALCVAFYAKDGHRQILNTAALLVAFFGTIYLHKHFFPLFVLAFFCYVTASAQELWSQSYVYLPVTKFLWSAGNFLIPFAVLDFIYRLVFKYKIVDKDGQKD